MRACSAPLWSRPPGRVLQHDAVAVQVLEGPTLLVPVRIERRHGAKARRQHERAPLLTLSAVRQIEDQEVVLRRRPPGAVSLLRRELQMVRRALRPQNRAVEPVVVVETRQYLQT